MATPLEVYQWFNTPVTCHSWNKDRTQIALSPNNNEIHIYGRVKESGQWEQLFVLVEHDKLITSLDWAPTTNRIVSCSQDRNAYVWQYDEKLVAWKPSLVILRINRAATFVRWSPQENKFAVASGARAISICYYESENDWWVSKHIRRPIRSTILSLAWHPDNQLLACGAADFCARIFSAHVDEIDRENHVPNSWTINKLEFGDLIAEFCHDRQSSGWVHSVAFSPSGNRLAWCTHDSLVCIAEATVNAQSITNVLRLACLPLMTVIFLDEEKIIGAGHDTSPMLISYTNQQLVFISKLDSGLEKHSKNLMTVAKAAMNMFRQMDSKAQAESDTQLDSIHQNTINSLMQYESRKDKLTKISSSGLDGKIVLWDMEDLNMEALLKSARRISMKDTS